MDKRERERERETFKVKTELSGVAKLSVLQWGNSPLNSLHWRIPEMDGIDVSKRSNDGATIWEEL